ncbi:MAG: aspartate carbamoyltransferase [Candidatus Uhrbacteria bacterium]
MNRATHNHSHGLPDKCSRYHFPSSLISTESLDRPAVDFLIRLAEHIRELSSDPSSLVAMRKLLAHESALLYFAQPSTRTYCSFVRACQLLGMQTSDVRDITTSSRQKGESELDTLHTFAAYHNLIIMRHHDPSLVSVAASHFNDFGLGTHMVNAGSGPHDHPTQALLDVYTIARVFGTQKLFRGLISVAIVGDIVRGRTSRSLITLLSRTTNARLHLIAPPELQASNTMCAELVARRTEYTLHQSLDEIISQVDVIYMTRIQDEYDRGCESKAIDRRGCILTDNRVRAMRPHSIILHPLPRRDEIDPSIDSDPRARYWQQERNGLWMRTALIAAIFEVTPSITRLRDALQSHLHNDSRPSEERRPDIHRCIISEPISRNNKVGTSGVSSWFDT